jgi:hypothetical protein
MSVIKFTIDSCLLDLVDAYGLDYEDNGEVDGSVIIEENVEELGFEELELLNDDELCSHLIGEDFIEGLLNCEREYA